MQTISVVGYGDITAKNSLEYSIAVLWMVLGAGFYSIFIGK
jgi:hypothetical protein